MQLRDVTVRYGGRPVLCGADAVFSPGVIHHLVGRNGTGKSTLAKTLAGIVPHQGAIEGCEAPVVLIGSYSGLPGELRVRDICKLARRRAAAGIYAQLNEGLAVGSIPGSQRVRSLSDGQRQKLKLLFFLSGGARTVILDEMTNALDQASCREICAFLNAYLGQPGMTSVNITHDIADLERMPGDCFLLEDGKICAGYSRDQILARYLGKEVA